MNYIIHDMDRDGWGSAALIVNELGANSCKLLPTQRKNVLGYISKTKARQGDTIWVLDIPAPEDWGNLSIRHGARLVWVDHHLAAWEREPPPVIETHLPGNAVPTTTMSLLIAHGLVAGSSEAAAFVRALCSAGAAGSWGYVFDGLSTMKACPIDLDQLPQLLIKGPRGESVPMELQSVADSARREQDRVQAILTAAGIHEEGPLAVAWISDACQIPLKHYSLAIRRQFPARVSVVVHRKSTLYCGRDSQRPGLDFLQHFRARGLDPRGHAYVCFVHCKVQQVDEELAALREAVGRVSGDNSHTRGES